MRRAGSLGVDPDQEKDAERHAIDDERQEGRPLQPAHHEGDRREGRHEGERRGEPDVGVKMGAKVVPGSIQRDVASQTISFAVTDGQVTYPVVYRGLAPDTFTDDVEVVVEGRLQPDGTFRATTVLAKHDENYRPRELEKTLAQSGAQLPPGCSGGAMAPTTT